MVRDWVTTEQARNLRRNASRGERLLWEQLRERRLGVKFRRQHPLGPYIVDFCCISQRLVVEIDGPLHDLTKDQLRDRELADRGYLTLRFTDLDVHRDVDHVVAQIKKHLRTG